MSFWDFRIDSHAVSCVPRRPRRGKWFFLGHLWQTDVVLPSIATWGNPRSQRSNPSAQTIVTTALPSIIADFNASESDFTWVGSSYMLAAAGMSC